MYKEAIKTIISAILFGLTFIMPALGHELYEVAKKEGSVRIYAATDFSQVSALIAAFERKYPGIKVEYDDLGTYGTYNRVISEAAARQVSADVIWSSAMDLQLRLYKDGLLEPYVVKDRDALPSWAVYGNAVYATTIEPIGLIYNISEFQDRAVPATEAELLTLIRSDETLQRRIATYDPEKSGTGVLLHTNAAETTPLFWDIAEAFGDRGGKTYSSTGAMRESVASGENALAFSLIGSYAIDWATNSDTLGVAFFTDKNRAFSRVGSIAKDAPHPNAGKIFLDFLLSIEGQEALASKGLPSVRSDTTSGLNIANLADTIGAPATPIALDEKLLEYLEIETRVKFLRRWKKSVRKQK